MMPSPGRPPAPERPRRDSRVLIVDDDAAIRGVVAKVLTSCGCSCRMAGSGEEALQLLQRDAADVVFIDVNMPAMSGLELAGRLSRDYPETALVMLTGMTEFGTAVAAIQSGAADFVAKPFKTADLVQAHDRAVDRRRTMLRAHRARLLEEEVARQSAELSRSLAAAATSSSGLVEAFLLALRARSESAASHAYRVAELSARIGQSLDLPPAEIEALRRAALLHEIGRLAIPDGAGTAADEASGESVLARRVPQIGHDIVSRVPALAECARGILSHCEHVDGTGFPLGLEGTAIPLGGRIIAVADAYDTLTRSASPARSSAEAIGEIEAGVQTRYDPTVVTGLLLAVGDPREAGLLRGVPLGDPLPSA
jgi:putative two-component system response regulator